MDDRTPPHPSFDTLYGELYDSLCRFDAMMQQSPFGSSLWWRPSAWLPNLGIDSLDSHRQQRQGQQYPALQQSGNRGDMTSWSGSLSQWPQGHAGWFQHNSCIPRMDLRDAGDKIVLHADMPGLEKGDVKVEAHDGRLSIHAQKSNKHEQGDGNWYIQERCNSSFYRTFTLPPGTQQEGIKATYNNGVLEVNIPKVSAPSTPPSKSITIE